MRQVACVMHLGADIVGLGSGNVEAAFVFIVFLICSEIPVDSKETNS